MSARDISYELARGLAYRSIRHGSMYVYTIALPVILWACLIGIYLMLPHKPPLLGKDGAISAALSVISTLPGFYFAGLAAVATFGSSSMDNEMPPPTPVLDIRVQGVVIPVKLTRRQFLSYLFSYLVIVSFLLCFLMVFLNLLAPSLADLHAHLTKMAIGPSIWFWGKAIIVALIGGLFSSMLVTTLHGVFFLTEKIHQP